MSHHGDDESMSEFRVTCNCLGTETCERCLDAITREVV